MKGRPKRPNSNGSVLDVEAAPGHEPLERNTMPENKLKESKIGSTKSITESKAKIEPKKEKLGSNESKYVETYI